MKKGEVALVTIPPEYAIGFTELKQDLAVVPTNSTLIHEVELVSFVKDKESVYALAMNDTGSLLVSGGTERVVRVWDPGSGSKNMKWGGPVMLNPEFVMCDTTLHLELLLTFSLDGFKIENLDWDSCEDDEMMGLHWEISDIICIGCKWTLSVGSALITLLVGSGAETGNSGPVRVQFCLIDLQWPRKQQKNWHLASGYQEIWNNIPSDDFASENWSLIVICYPGEVETFEDGELTSIISNAHVGNAYSLARTHLPYVLFTGGEDGAIRLFSVYDVSDDEDINPATTWVLHTGTVHSLAFEYPWLVSASSDGRISLIDLRKLLTPKSSSKHPFRVKSFGPSAIEPPQRMLHGFGCSIFPIDIGIKLGVQYSLWEGSVINLGTKKHRDKFFDRIDNLNYPGCFAMIELHHGSNVQALQTTATFDPVTDEFIINTPNDGAIKWWIGNAAVHGNFATVFARLILPLQGKGGDPADMGIHAFIVPIRDLETHAVLPEIGINDCGHKIGLNGVDNGALRFCSVRIPRENLLNRFGDVARDGKYTSSLPTINKRFAATLGELVGERVGLAYSSVGVLKVAVTIVVRYALLRHQFSPPKQPEISVMESQSHQHKLMPMLASSYAFHFAIAYLVDKCSEMKKTNDEDVITDVHVLSSGLKAYITLYTAESIRVCRESCGGHGCAAVNRFGVLRNDHDIFQTFVGDNTVLLLQVAGDVLKQYQEKFKEGTLSVTWNYLRDSMSTYLSQPNPVTARWEGEDHLRDPNILLDDTLLVEVDKNLFNAVKDSMVQWVNWLPEEASWEDANFIKGAFPEFYSHTIRSWFPDPNT